MEASITFVMKSYNKLVYLDEGQQMIVCFL
jgi:hypothetical protein